MMADLASSIMRRRASIEPQEEEEEEASGNRGGGAGVLGLRAYLAAKDSAPVAAGSDNEEWE
jgi:hypothetical protein